MHRFESFSSAGTRKFGESLAKKIIRKGPISRRATILALQGELGAGKTTFVQGFYKGLGIRARVTSPTFILMRRHSLGGRFKSRGFRSVYHVDFYRIHRTSELPKSYLQEITQLPENIILIEWPERAEKIISNGAVKILFHHGARENERTIIISRSNFK